MASLSKETAVISTFDSISRILAAPVGRRRTLQLLAASLTAAIWPKKAMAQVFTCGAPVNLSLTAANPTCDGVLTGALCTTLSAQVTQSIIALCPASCPPSAVVPTCGCNAGTVTATASAICLCATGTGCGQVCCPAGQLCCGGVCVASSCANCGTCGNVCPAGSCCVGGQCVTSGVTPCC